MFRPAQPLRRRVAALVAATLLSTGAAVVTTAAPAAASEPVVAPVTVAAPAPQPTPAPDVDALPDVIAETFPADAELEPLPALDMSAWRAIPVLRPHANGDRVPAVHVVQLDKYGVTPADLANAGIPAFPWEQLATLTNDVIMTVGVAEHLVLDLLPETPTLPTDGGGASTQSVPAGSQLPLAVYYDQSMLNQYNGRATADNAWGHTVTLFQNQMNIPIHRVILLTGGAVPNSNVSSFCHMQTLARYEMGFGSYVRGLVIFSADTVEGGTQGVAIGGDVDETLERGQSQDYCGGPDITPPVIPSVYVSGFLDTTIPSYIDSDKTGVAYVAAHEVGHILGMEHNMARCWSGGFNHTHKTLESFTSGTTRPECGYNWGSDAHYHWKFNDYTPQVGEAAVTGYMAITEQWDRFANCQASGWCTSDATPSAPRNVVATPGNGQVTLSWTAPQYQGGAPVQGYCWYYGTTPNFINHTGSCWGSSPSAPITGLTNGQTYYFYVRAHNGQVGGQAGPRSAYVSAVPQNNNNLTSTTLMSYPSSVSANTSFTVCWQVNGTGSISSTYLEYGPTTGLGSSTSAQAGTAPQSFCGSITAPASGTVYVRSRATGPSNTVTSSTVGITVNAVSQNDCSTGGDAGGSHAAATTISLPKSNCTGNLPAADEDWYQFSVTSGQAISASMTPNSGADFDICLYKPDGTVAVSCTGGTTGGTDTISYNSTTTGNFRLRVKIWSGTGSYTMSVSTATPQNDCYTGVDAGGSHGAAASITLPKSSCPAGLTYSSDSEDWYQFYVTSGQSISLSMTPNASADFDLCLVDPANVNSNCSTAGTGATDSVTLTASSTGYWRSRVYIYGSSTGSYTMSVSASGGGGPVTIRDDDNEKDVDLRMNYNDDVAVKRLNITSTQLSGKTTATLYIYGMTWGCPSSVGNKYRLRANGSSVTDFNPCNRWSSSSFGWSSFTVPISYLTAGTNSFDFYWLTGDWTSGNVYLGVDSDTDYGRSDTSYDSTTLNGELMWYLVLS